MKIHWTLKVVAFLASVFALSWFFAGWRAINESPGLASWACIGGGTLSTILLLGLQGYWIYFEEKNKGTLRKRIAVFEKIHSLIASRSGSHTNHTGTDSCCAKEAKGT